MSDHSHQEAEPRSPEYFDYKHVGGRFLGVAALAILALITTFVLGGYEPKQFAFSWLFGFTVFLTICMGALFWVLVHHGVDAEWSVVVRRQLENLAGLLPVMALLFVPLIFVAPHLWYWMKIPPGQDVLLDEKWPYLTDWFFWIRSAFYFGFFTLSIWLLKKFSVAQDTSGSPKYTIWNRKVTFASLPLFAVSLTFGAVDWLMGLDFHWFSTMWGVYLFAGSALSAMCVLVLLITALRSAGYLKGIVSIEHYHIMGKLMFAFTVFWAYIGFSQYMLIWYANIPEETVYYLIRNVESWNTLNIILVIGHFWVPFLLLLPQASKRSPVFLCIMAIWILAMHVLDIYIIVLPALHKTGFSPSILDLLALIAIGATLMAVFLKKLGDTPLWPLRDPRLPQSLRLLN